MHPGCRCVDRVALFDSGAEQLDVVEPEADGFAPLKPAFICNKPTRLDFGFHAQKARFPPPRCYAGFCTDSKGRRCAAGFATCLVPSVYILLRDLKGGISGCRMLLIGFEVPALAVLTQGR